MIFRNYLKEKGLTLFELVFALSMASIIAAIVIPSYFGYQKSTEKYLHVMNTQQVLSVVESGILEKWVPKPNSGETVSITFSEMASNNAYISFIDPSASNRTPYNMGSSVQLYNNSGVLEFYVKLTNAPGDHTYIDTTGAANTQGSKQIHLIDKSDIDIQKE